MTNKEQFKKGEYGFLPLTDVVDRYMINSFNTGQKYYKAMLLMAAETYKQLYWKTLRVPKNKRVAVDKTTMTVRMPHDCLKLVGVKIIDHCDNTQYMTHNPYKNIVAPPVATGCGCKVCACQSDLCLYINGITHVTEDVELNGQTYQRVIKTKVCPNGDMIQEITDPYAVKNGNAIEISFFTRQERIAALTVLPCGCVEPTQDNRKTCYQVCGCPVDCCDDGCDNNERVRRSRDGNYKVDDCIIYLFDTSAAFVEVSYVSTGEECATEIMIPEYCVEAMYAGLFLGSIRFRQNVSPMQKREAKRDFEIEKQELYEFLNPIAEHDFLALQGYFPKW